MVYEVGDEPVPGYRLVTFIGRGNSGDVWKALGPGRVLVAFKIIQLDSKLGRRERKAILGLRNFNDNALVNIYGLWFKDREGNILEYSEELEDDNAGLPQAPLARKTTSSPTSTTTSGSGSHPKLAVRPTPRPAVTPSPGYLGHTVDPEAEDAAARLGDTTDHRDANSTTGSTGSQGSGSGSHSGSGSQGSDIHGASSDTASGSGGTDITGSGPGGTTGKSSKSATELIVAMTLGDMTLGNRLEECQAEGHAGIPLKELQRLMRDAARGIDYLNCRHFQHCDIKPENILIVGSGAKICDFGLARPTKVDLGATQSPNGFTWACAAPEQLARGKDVVNFSDHTDQYSLATAYYRLRTGKFPFDENDISDLIRRKRDGKLDLSSKILSQRERVALLKALDLEPTRRYPTATDFVEELERANAPSNSSPVRNLVVAVAAAVLLVLVPLAGWWAWQEYLPSAAFRQLSAAVDAGDFAGAKTAFAAITRDSERAKGAKLLVDSLHSRVGSLPADQCKQLDELIDDGQTVVDALEDRKEQSQAEDLLADLKLKRSQIIPSAVRSKLESLLKSDDFAGVQRWISQELPSKSDCDTIVQAYARDELILAWLKRSREQAESEEAPIVLAHLDRLEREIRDARRDEYNDDVKQLRKAAMQSTRRKAVELFAQDSDADWRAAAPYWDALIRYDNAERADITDDILASLSIQVRGKQIGWPTHIQAELAKLASSHPADTRPARWRLLAALAQVQSLTATSPANDLTSAIDLAEDVQRAPPPKLGQELTAWEQTQVKSLALGLLERVSELPPEAQAPLLARLEKLLPGSPAERQLGQIRQLLSTGKHAEARRLLTSAKPNFPAAEVQTKLAYLLAWCDLLDPATNLTEVVPRVVAELRKAAPAEWSPLCDALATRVKHADTSAADAAIAMDAFLALREGSPSPPADFDLALARLWGWRLSKTAAAGENLPQVAGDASQLWRLKETLGTSAATNSAEMLPWPIVASLWLEATTGKMPEGTNEIQWKSVVATAQQPLTSEEQKAFANWTAYPAWVQLVTTPVASNSNAPDRLRTLYVDLPADSVLQGTTRRGRTAEFLWQSVAGAKLPTDAQIPANLSANELITVIDNLRLATTLAKDAKLPAAIAARLPATLAICDYYRLASKKESTAPIVTLADPLLGSEESRAALEAHEGLPSILKHLRYVRARAALSNLPPTPSDPQRQQLIAQAAEGLEAAFDFIGFQRVADVEAQEEADLDLYLGLVEPALGLATKESPAASQPSLAVVYAAQARLIERSGSVQSHLGSQGVKIKELFLLRRNGYDRASQWETRPPLIARNCLHHACTLLDWLGSRDVEVEIEPGQKIRVRDELAEVIKRASKAQPEHHATLFLVGLEELFASRDQGQDLCDLASSAALQYKHLEAAHTRLGSALASPTLTPEEHAEYLPRYFAEISAINLERAFIRPTIDERIPILNDARAQAAKAIAAAQKHPLKLFLDQAYLAEGNAYEDLALKCGLIENFKNSEASFKSACDAAGSGFLQAEGMFNLGRCQLRLALKSIPVSEREKLLEKLAEAETSLTFARDNLPRLGKPQMAAFAIETNLHLAGVYLEQAECYRAQSNAAAADQAVAKADVVYARAVTEAATGDPKMWANYQTTWLQRANKRFIRQRAENSPAAAETKTLVARLANELLSAAAQSDAAAVSFRPTTADQLGFAVKALLDTSESRAAAQAFADLRVGNIPSGWGPAMIAELKVVLDAKQKVLTERLPLFSRSNCDDVVLAALELLFDLHGQCHRVPQFAEHRAYARGAIDELADRLGQTDWKRTFAKAMTRGFGGLELADKLLFATPAAERPSKRADFLKAATQLVSTIEDLEKLAASDAEEVPRNVVGDERKTVAFRIALAKLMLELNTVVPATAKTPADKQLAQQVKAILNNCLRMSALRNQQTLFRNAIAEVEKFLE